MPLPFQNFLYIVDTVSGLKEKKFAVIIDEAHSSTAGKDMAAITMTLGAGEVDLDTEAPLAAEDIIVDEISRNVKQANVSIFAFTATPKATILRCLAELILRAKTGIPYLFYETSNRGRFYPRCASKISRNILRSIRLTKK